MRPLWLFLCLGLLLPPVLLSQGADVLPERFEGVGIDQRIGETIPLDVQFLDEEGRKIELSQYFGDKPVIIAPVYYRCPMLCQLVIEGFTRGLKALKFTADTEYELIAYSFDSREGPLVAKEKKAEAVQRFDREGAEEGWHFLTGSEAEIEKLSDALGFHYQWDATSQQFVHAASLVILTPAGKIARYLYGVEYLPRDLRLSLVEASENKLGSPIDQVLLYCYKYNPAVGKYNALTMNLLRIGGTITLVALASIIFIMMRAERQRSRHQEARK